MNAPKLLTLAALAFALYRILPENTATLSLWKSTSSTNESSHFSWMDGVPESYRLEIDFGDYLHTHTVNGGETRIEVHVNGSEDAFALGLATRSSAHYACELNGPSISGDITIDISTDYVGTISEERRKEILREKVIQKIIDKFASL